MAKASRRSKNVQSTQELKPSPKVSPPLSDSSMEDASNFSEVQPEASYRHSASHPGSPMQSGPLDPEDIVTSTTCQWEGYGKVFTHLPTLVHHIHNGGFQR